VRCHQEILTITTSGQGLQPITDKVESIVRKAGLASGLCTLFIRHTSASLLIQENADPTVRSDLSRFFERLVPEGSHYDHDAEGPDDMPAHIKAALLPTALPIPILDGRLGLGTWQGIYLWEHRRRGHRREVIVQILGTESSTEIK
jgi:secondary thiamine-phosphate synthase enzyme